MERKLQERMVGASVLILALVVLGPVILSGGGREEPQVDTAPGQRSDELRSHTFNVGERRIATPAPASGDGSVTDPQPVIESTPAARPPQAAVAQPAPGAVAPAIEPPAAAPVTRNAPEPRSPPLQQEPPPEPAPAAQRPVASGWVVQVGTFGQKANAERLVASLRKSGFEAFVSATERAGKELYRVRVGPPGSREAATAVATRLVQAGQTGQVVSQ
jgi:DedD protein